MPVLAGARRAVIAVILAGCLGIGCASLAHTSEPVKPSHQGPDKKIIPRDEGLKPLQVFETKSFYLERPEPEEDLVGIFQMAPVQEGPNTREMPLRLVVGTDTLRVYAAGFDLEALRPYIGQTVKVVGKRIDQRKEGYGIEIWISTIILLR